MFYAFMAIVFGPWLITMLWMVKLLIVDTIIMGVWEGITDDSKV
jgi:hypothetical protein